MVLQAAVNSRCCSHLVRLEFTWLQQVCHMSSAPVAMLLRTVYSALTALRVLLTQTSAGSGIIRENRRTGSAEAGLSTVGYYFWMQKSPAMTLSIIASCLLSQAATHWSREQPELPSRGSSTGRSYVV